MMSGSWQGAETAQEADELARQTVLSVSTARRWWTQADDHARVALDVARDSAEDAGEYWAVLQVSWDEAGMALPLKPDGWDKLAGVWKQAGETRGSALAAEDAQSVVTIVSGALRGSAEDVAELSEESAGAFSKAVEWASEHPYATVAIVGGLAIGWRAAPEVLAALVRR